MTEGAKELIDRAFSVDDFRSHGHQLIDILANYLQDAMHSDHAAAIQWESPDDQLDFWKKDFTSAPARDPLDLFRTVLQKSVHLHNKRYMGHQTAVTLPVSALSSLVVDLLNNGMGVYEMGMAGNAMEKMVIEHIAGKMGYDSSAGGFITSGGSLGNLTALLAARAVAGQTKQYCIFASQEAHYCIERSARIIGADLVRVPVDASFKMRLDLLEELYSQETARGKNALCVIGSACSTATGSYDDLEGLGKFCNAHGIWLHVDAAHGGAAIFSPKYQHLLNCIHHADSVIVDFHKMMMTPGLSTAVVFKNGNHAYATFSQDVKYLWSDESAKEWYNSAKRTFECTKSMSVLKVYTIFRMHGDEIFRAYVEKLYDLAREFASLIKSRQDLELATDPESNIVCFRHNTDNSGIRSRLLHEGRFYIVETTIGGKLYLRVSLMNPFTTMKELEELLFSFP